MTQELTQEQKATNFDTMQHINMVRKFLNMIVTQLIERGTTHDQTKLADPEVDLFVKYTPELSKTHYGSPEYLAALQGLKPALDHHYANSRHHPEFGARGEKWKDIPGYEEHYQVSNLGRVRSKDRRILNSRSESVFRAGQKMKYTLTPHGYHRLQLIKDGEYRYFHVHQLVALAFLPNPDNKPMVRHKNANRQDNHVDNLEWVAASENLIQAYEAGFKESNVKYIVRCNELDIITEGCTKMERALIAKGYDKAQSSGIWRCITYGGSHLDLTFDSCLIEEHQWSDIDKMNLVDLVEMLCDWKAATLRQKDGNLTTSIALNKDRFGIDAQLVGILNSSADLFE